MGRITEAGKAVEAQQKGSASVRRDGRGCSVLGVMRDLRQQSRVVSGCFEEMVAPPEV